MFRERVRRWHMAIAGYRIYLLVFLLALPDILDGLAGFDFAVILPEGWGVKAATVLAMLRVIFSIYVRKLAANQIIKEPRGDDERGEH